jgi:DNA-binding NtrC family response regulator
VLVVDDDHALRASCGSLLRNAGLSVTVCGRGDDAKRLLKNQVFDILLVDLFLPEVSGLDVLQTAIKATPDIVAIVVTGQPSVESSVSVLQAGAWDYLPKPFSATHFEILVGRAAHAVAERRQARLDTNFDSPPDLGGHVELLGTSAAIRQVLDLATKVARTNASVFITGESGSGKEVIAQYIHRHSRRRDRELVAVNCAAIPEALLESEMFGHVEGAFTGAVRSKKGLLEVADGSTLFLDELTELPLPTQAKLLRVLQDGVVRRVGSTKVDSVVDVRFIAATNRSPVEAIQSGDLRKDFYYRLRVVPLHIPSLQERPEDIPILAQQFLREFWERHRDGSAGPPPLTTAAIECLVRAPWPGNVRELRNVIEHAVVLVDHDGPIETEDLAFLGDEARVDEISRSGFSPAVMNLDYHSARERILSEFEVEYLSHIVRESGGNISDAARVAGVDRTTLYRLMEKHGIRKDGVARAPLG